MNHFLLVGQAVGNLGKYADLLNSDHGIKTTQVTLSQDAINLISNQEVDFVIVDEKLDDLTGVKFVELMVQASPMMLCSLISSLPPKDFHESSEGLGVLSQLPVQPTSKEIDELLERFNSVASMS